MGPCKPHAACIPAPRPDLHAPLSFSTSAHRQRVCCVPLLKLILQLRYTFCSPSPFDFDINHSCCCQGLPRNDETPVLPVSASNAPWTALPSRIPGRVTSPDLAADGEHSFALASASSTDLPDPRTSQRRKIRFASAHRSGHTTVTMWLRLIDLVSGRGLP